MKKAGHLHPSPSGLAIGETQTKADTHVCTDTQQHKPGHVHVNSNIHSDFWTHLQALGGPITQTHSSFLSEKVLSLEHPGVG